MTWEAETNIKGPKGDKGDTGVQGPQGPQGVPGPNDWADITGKPATFPPTLPIPQSGVTNLVADLAARPTDAPVDGKQYARKDAAWDEVEASGGNPLVPTQDTPPASPLDGQLWWDSDAAILYVYYDDGDSQQWVQTQPSIKGDKGDKGDPGTNGTNATKTAVPFNFIVNPCMQVSQQNGNTLGTTSGFYPADQWLSSFVAAGAAFSIQRVAIASYSGSNKALEIKPTTAKASLAAGDYLCVGQRIEGNRVLGTQMWKRVGANFVRFAVQSNVMGTYTLALRNPPAYEITFLKTFVISNTDINVFNFPIGAPWQGTFPTDNTNGLELWFTLAAGSTYTSGLDMWVYGDALAGPGQVNFLASTAGSPYFRVFDVGLYADPENTGAAPTFEVPAEADVLRDCMRYFQGFDYQLALYAGAGVSLQVSKAYLVPMRVAPVSTLTSAGSVSNATAVDIAPRLNDAVMLLTVTAAGLGASYNRFYALNARM